MPVLRPLLACCLLAGMLLLAACGRKTEQQQLDSLRDSMGYTQYRRLSQHGLATSYAAWRISAKLTAAEQPVQELDPQAECIAHSLLGYSALTADRTTLAIAEADIVDALPACQAFAQISAALRAVAFQRLEWPGLALQQNNLAIGDGALPPDDAEAVRATYVLAHAVLGYNALAEGHAEIAQVHIDAISLALGTAWLAELSRAGIALQNGDIQQSLMLLKKLGDNPQVPADTRALIKSTIGQIELETGNVDSKLWLARMFARVVWNELKHQAPARMAGLMNFVDQQGTKADQMVDDGRNMVGGWWQAAKQALKGKRAPADD